MILKVGACPMTMNGCRDMTSPLLTVADLPSVGAFRLFYVPGGTERPAGIISIPIESWIDRARQSQSGLDEVDFWRAEFEGLGIGRNGLNIIVDDGRLTEAARVWFILQYFGLPAAVLNGGVAAVPDPLGQAPAADEPLVLTPGAGRVGLKDRRALKAALPDVQVFDARTRAEYVGDDLKGNRRGGHLPGAALLPHSDLIAGTSLRPASEIAGMLAAAGIDPPKPVVTHCNAGGRAALAALAAVVAGHSDVSVYYLSFADWAADDACPIRRP